MGWRDSLETVPTIKKLRSKAESIRSGELDKAMSKLGEELSPKQRKVLGDVQEHREQAPPRADAGAEDERHERGGGGADARQHVRARADVQPREGARGARGQGDGRRAEEEGQAGRGELIHVCVVCVPSAGGGDFFLFQRCVRGQTWEYR